MQAHRERGGVRTRTATDMFSWLISLQQDIFMVHFHASPGQRYVTNCDADRGLQNACLVDLSSDVAAIVIPPVSQHATCGAEPPLQTCRAVSVHP